MHASDRSDPTDFFVAGGTLRADAPSYVPRQADDDLYTGLSNGEYCYVLTSRQMGKSSLMVRAARRLQDDGAQIAVLDLTAFGQNVTPEQWYESLLLTVGARLDVEDEVEEFWEANRNLTPLRRWFQTLREVVLAQVDAPVIIFIDEIDVVQSLPFSTNEFFAGIRECYTRRTQDDALARLTFCLIGVATPSDLIDDPLVTPFNIGMRIDLRDFHAEEASRLSAGLPQEGPLASVLAERIFHWTGGHPYLSQRLCQAVSASTHVSSAQDVDAACEGLFFAEQAQTREGNLEFVRGHMLREDVDHAGLLSSYAQILRGRDVPHDETHPLISVLTLSGIAKVVDGYLRPRNRVYVRVFGSEWVLQNMPEAELRRQQEAFRKGTFQAASLAVFMFLAVCILVLTAVTHGFRADRLAIQAQAEHDRAVEILRAFVPAGSSGAAAAFLVERDPATRLQAVLTLGATRTPAEGAVAALTLVVEDPNQDVRTAAIVALGQWGANATPSAATLVSALRARDPLTRGAAANSLGMIYEASRPTEGGAWETARTVLDNLLDDEDIVVRTNAQAALAKMTAIPDAQSAP